MVEIFSLNHLLTRNVHCKQKVRDFSVPSRDVNNQTSSWPGIIKLFPDRESLDSDIPAGDRKITNLFFTVYVINKLELEQIALNFIVSHII
jgi:hypothetical protein